MRGPHRNQLDYRTAAPPKPLFGNTRYFSYGFFGGLGVSLLCWLVPGYVIHPLALLFPLILIKFIGGAILLYLPDMEPVGWGVLTSLMVGICISPGMCWMASTLYHTNLVDMH